MIDRPSLTPDGQSQASAHYLLDRRKKRKPRYAQTPHGMMFPLERSIHNRPEHIKTRENFGASEGDLMIFRREHDKTNVASLVKRKTRYALLFRNNDRSPSHFMARLMNVMEPLPRLHVSRSPSTAGLSSRAGESSSQVSEPKRGSVIHRHLGAKGPSKT